MSRVQIQLLGQVDTLSQDHRLDYDHKVANDFHGITRGHIIGLEIHHLSRYGHEQWIEPIDLSCVPTHDPKQLGSLSGLGSSKDWALEVDLSLWETGELFLEILG